LRRRAHHDLEVDSHGIEIGEALVVARHHRPPLCLLAQVDRFGVRRREAGQRDSGGIEMRLDELRRAGTATCECMSMVTLCGRTMRPGFAPAGRAAVGP
jgi:hypothetical protein